MKTATLLGLRAISVLVGFTASVSFMRAQNRAYNFYISRILGENFWHWFNFGTTRSVVLLGACLMAFAVSIWLRKGAHIYPVRRVDYWFLLLFCGAGFAACTQMVLSASLPLGIWADQSPLFSYVIVVPFVAYFFTLLAFGELIARLRDKTLLTTLYWVEFFRVYSVWRPTGFFALLLLVWQMIIIIMFYYLPVVAGTALFVIGVLTYFAVHMINLAAEYDIASADKIKGERFKSELITNVSHDIKTPLTSIINYVDLLNGEALEGKAAEYVNVLTRKSARLKVLIDDLMEASKAGTGNLSVDLQSIDFTEIIGQVAGEFEDNFTDNGLTLVIRPSGEAHIHVKADSRHLYRALENLFANAAKYGLGGTRVFAEIIPYSPLSKGKAMFALQNTSALPIDVTGGELTEQFIRGDKARQTEGSGLGLYIAKSLVELMGGTLDIHVIGDLFRVEIELDYVDANIS